MDADSRNAFREQETMIKKLKDEISSMKDVIRAQEKELQALRKLNQKLEDTLDFYKNTVDRIFQITDGEERL